MFKLIIGGILIITSAFLGKTEKTKNGDYRLYQRNGEIICEQEEYTYRKKFRNTGEAIGAVMLITVGTCFIVSYLFEKDDKEKSEKKGENNAKRDCKGKGFEASFTKSRR